MWLISLQIISHIIKTLKHNIICYEINIVQAGRILCTCQDARINVKTATSFPNICEDLSYARLNSENEEQRETRAGLFLY